MLESETAGITRFFSMDKTKVRNVHSDIVLDVRAVAVIGGMALVVGQSCAESQFVAAVNTHAGRIDADGCHVGADGTHGAAQGHRFGRALIEILRKQHGIICTLPESRDSRKNCCYNK